MHGLLPTQTENFLLLQLNIWMYKTDTDMEWALHSKLRCPCKFRHRQRWRALWMTVLVPSLSSAPHLKFSQSPPPQSKLRGGPGKVNNNQNWWAITGGFGSLMFQNQLMTRACGHLKIVYPMEASKHNARARARVDGGWEGELERISVTPTPTHIVWNVTLAFLQAANY